MFHTHLQKALKQMILISWNQYDNIQVFPAAEESDQLFQLPLCPESRREDPEERKHVSL